MENGTGVHASILLEDISRESGIDLMKAELALGTVLEFLSAQLSSPIMGRIVEAISYETDVKKLGKHRNS